jgi:hypothetical protein
MRNGALLLLRLRINNTMASVENINPFLCYFIIIDTITPVTSL